jgi:RNA polymerase sigma-70 factor (ECF subfamily)
MRYVRQQQRSVFMTSPTVDDTELLRRIAAQENDAFTALYARYAPQLLCYLTRRLGQRALAEEVCHDTLLTIWQKARHYDPAIPFAPWLFGIARHKALTALRSVKPLRAAASALPDQDTADDPETFMIQHEHAGAVARTLATLPLAQRDVVNLAYYHGCAYSDIAARLNCPIGTVKTRMAHARRRLLPALTALGLAPPSSTGEQRQRPTCQGC